jgi:hypothetical protein
MAGGPSWRESYRERDGRLAVVGGGGMRQQDLGEPPGLGLRAVPSEAQIVDVGRRCTIPVR